MGGAGGAGPVISIAGGVSVDCNVLRMRMLVSMLGGVVMVGLLVHDRDYLPPREKNLIS